MFKCGICGKEWNTVEERSKCEFECLKTQAAKKEEEKKRKAEVERKEFKDKIDKLYNVYEEAKNNFSDACKTYQEKYNIIYQPKYTNNHKKLYEGNIDASLVNLVKEMERMGWM